MEIKTESQLVKELARQLTSVFNTDIAITELSAGYGIVDLAFARGFISHKNALKRKPINNYLGLKLLLTLTDNSIFSTKDVIKITGSSTRTSRAILRALMDAGYIERVGCGQFRKTDSYCTSPIKKIIAIEAKLKDWKRGAMQARRYKSFTDECYLAILSKYEKNIDLNYIKKFGIGLIIFNPDSGKISFKTKPKRNSYLAFYDETLSIYAKEMFLHAYSTKTFSESPSM